MKWKKHENEDPGGGGLGGCGSGGLRASVARLIKAEWPSAQVGGPNTMGPGESFEKFVKYCADERLPLDFAAYTNYDRDPLQFAGSATYRVRLRVASDRVAD